MLSSAKTGIDFWRLVRPEDVVVQRAGSTLRHASAPLADKRAAVERARKEAEAKRIEEDAAARGSELDRGTVVELRL